MRAKRAQFIRLSYNQLVTNSAAFAPDENVMNAIEEYIAAWSLWSQGLLGSDYLLWGVAIFWWARIGRIISAVSALTIVLEIIGPERLRRFGSRLRTNINFRWAARKVIRLSRTVTRLFSFAAALLASSDDRRLASTMDELFEDSPIITLFIHVLLIGFVVLSIQLVDAYLYDSFWIMKLFVILLTAAVLWIISIVIVIILYAGASLLFTLGALAINALVLKPMVWVLEQPDLSGKVRIISVALLIIGFHFDLLAS
ncbi:hypothetical protein FBR02_06975 [Anaerolineae bacterium CFX9]|nr:hypothetical protein [Anaerolineae bacterium CFX9]